MDLGSSGNLPTLFLRALWFCLVLHPEVGSNYYDLGTAPIQ